MVSNIKIIVFGSLLSCLLISINPIITANNNLLELNNFPSYDMKYNIINPGELKVITDKEVYLTGEKVNISIINIGTVDLGGEPHLRVDHVTQEGIITVHEAPPNDLSPMVLVNESFSYTWGQIDTNGLKVEEGEFSILFFFVMCGGIRHRNETTFKIQEEPIYIESFQGGFGISVIFRNIGINKSYNINYSIEASGLILFGSKKEEQIDIIMPQENITIHHNIIGIGRSMIKITVGNVMKIKNCFIIGSYIYL